MRCRFLQLDERLSNLREVVEKEEKEFRHLLNQKISVENDLYAIRNETRELGERVKTFKEVILVQGLQERKTSLQTQVKNLTAQLKELRPNFETLSGEIKRLEAEKNKLLLDRDQLRSEKAEKIKKTNELAERIIEDAEQARKRVLAEAEEEKKRLLADGEETKMRILQEIEKLRAEEALLKTAIRMRVEECKKARERLEGEEPRRVPHPHEPVADLLSSIPKLPPLKSVKKD